MQRLGTFGLRILTVVACIGILISACSAPEPQVIEVTREVPVTVVAEVTKEVPVTVVVTQLVEVVVTATPEPTATLEPTATPEPTATVLPPTEAPALAGWTSAQVAEAFSNAGLEAVNVRPLTKDDYGMAPMVALEGSRFFIPSLCPDCGGRIFSFSSQSDLDILRTYYTSLAESSALFFSWVFAKDNILVQINGDLPEDIARQYEAVLDTLD